VIDPDFSIGEKEVRESIKTFVKGMNEGERRRFLGIYAKYQDKGGTTKPEEIRNQKQIQH
jgi:hypothetical protein